MSLDTDRHEAQRRFDELAAPFVTNPAVSKGTRFGSSAALTVRNKIFAMLVRGALVVKLPRARVDQLVAAQHGARFDPGHGRLMREWLTVPFDRVADWEHLITEAYAFVGRA